MHGQHRDRLSFAAEVVEDVGSAISGAWNHFIMTHTVQMLFVSQLRYIITLPLAVSFLNMERPHTQGCPAPRSDPADPLGGVPGNLSQLTEGQRRVEGVQQSPEVRWGCGFERDVSLSSSSWQ